MADAPLWFGIVATLWGMGAGPVGFVIGRRDRKKATIPNIRPSFTASTLGYSGSIEIHARTSEDIIITRIEAAGPIHDGEPSPNYSDEGNITGFTYDFAESPRVINWRIPGGETKRFKITVDSLYNFDIVLTVSSSAETLSDMRLKITAI